MLRVKKRDLRVLLGTQKLKDYLDRIQKKGNLFLLETGQLVATTYYIHDIRMLLLTPETYIYVSYFFFYFSARRCQGDRSKKKPEKLQPSLFLFFYDEKKRRKTSFADCCDPTTHNVDIPQEVYRLCDALRLPSSYVSAKRMTKHPSRIEKATPKYLHLFILSRILSLYQNLQQKN